MMLLLSLVLLVTSEAGAMEVTRTVSSFTRSRVSLQYREVLSRKAKFDLIPNIYLCILENLLREALKKNPFLAI